MANWIHFDGKNHVIVDSKDEAAMSKFEWRYKYYDENGEVKERVYKLSDFINHPQFQIDDAWMKSTYIARMRHNYRVSPDKEWIYFDGVRYFLLDDSEHNKKVLSQRLMQYSLDGESKNVVTIKLTDLINEPSLQVTKAWMKANVSEE